MDPNISGNEEADILAKEGTTLFQTNMSTTYKEAKDHDQSQIHEQIGERTLTITRQETQHHLRDPDQALCTGDGRAGVWGHLNTPGIQPLLFPERATTDVQVKHGSTKRPSDDSVVYSKSKSSLLQAGAVRHHHRRRGDSFNVGKLNSVQSERRVDPVRSYHPLPETQSSSGTNSLLIPFDRDSGRGYNDNCRLSSPVRDKDNSANMNRRRSDGPSSHASPSINQQNQHLLSTKSSPNLIKTGDDQVESDYRMSRTASRDHIQLVKSSPSLLDDVIYKQLNMDVKYQADVSRSSDFIVRQGGYGDFGDRTYTVGLYTSDGSSPRQNVRRSLPAHGLHRYQPDYENVSHLGTAPLRSEKISEIEDIDEVTGRDSNPQSPDVKEYDPFRGAGLPTRDPASLKYIKVNQNHEKYPSWPVTKPNGATEQTQPINSRAQSMTDHTSTSKEFPKKQQLAFTPGLRPLAEKNSPTSDRKADDGKARNGSDPGFKSEFVYGRYGRVQRRDVGNSEGRFDDFYNNSKPGYPPPNMDPDGRNLGDKEYNAPSPPERDSKGVDYTELSIKLGNVDGCGKTDIGHTPQGGAKRIQDLFYPLNQMNTSAGPRTRPSELSLNVSKGSPKQNFDSIDTGTSPFDKSSSLFNLSQKGTRASSHVDGSSIQQNRHPSLYDSKHSFSKQDGSSHPLLASPNTHSQTSHTPAMNWRSPSQKDAAVQRDKPYSSYDRSPSHSGKLDIPNFPSSGDKNKAYIVKSTPYYNTSTQTDMLPYAIKMSDPSSAAIRSKHAEIQVGGFSTDASPNTLEEQKKLSEEKSTQARMSRDFEHNDLNSNNKRQSFGSKEQNEDFFRYPSSIKSAGQTSPFKGIQSIHAKYATDELYDQNVNTDRYKAVLPTFSDNASMLRKLSEEFYGSKLGLMQEKRMSSSSSQESPRFDPAHPIHVQQPGMREAESYSSIVIHQDEKSGLFGGDDVSSVSSFADSKHDVSSIHLDSTSDYKSIDMLPTRGRGSINSSYPSQKTRLHQQDPKTPSSKVHNKELSGPATSFNVTPGRGLSRVGGKVTDQPMLSGPSSDAPLTTSNSRSVSSDTRSSQSTSISSSAESPFSQIAPASFSSSSKQAHGKQTDDVRADKSRTDRVESDSVFVADDDDMEADDLSDYEFSRKPSMRKAYGIYDETERLISQSKALTQAAKSGSERQATQSVGVTVPVSAVAPSRSNRYSESLGLGRIQEESDAVNAGNDVDSSSLEAPASGKKKANEQVLSGKSEKLEKYPWQNEAWLRSQMSVQGESNLRRTSSEQIALPKQNMNMKVSSYDTDCGLQRSGQANPATFSASAFHNYQKVNPLSPLLDVYSTHSRTKSEDLLRQNAEQDQATFAQQDQRRYYDHNTDQPKAANRGVKDTFSAGFSPPESAVATRSSSDSVADVIHKVNENLAKSAERVDSIRRSNSSLSRSSSEYVDMTRDRNRRETDWSRLRTSGSLRYSPDHERRSSRSSFASENLYEDISAFTSSTPRSSFAESTEKNHQPGNSNASMDSGLVASPTYQNFPYQRRAPPLPPRSPSPDETPPALPPRKYREHQQSDDGDITPPTSHVSSMSPGFSVEKNGINVLSVSNQPNEENQVDRTKRDFKSLMTQWENNTPREDKYAAELRKQAQKFNSNQHQHVNAMPASYERTRTKINFATTYKHEPMQPQEATSPQSSSLPPSSQTPNISTIVSSSFSVVSLSSSSPSSAQPSSNFHQQSSKSNNSRATRPEGGPATSNNSPSSNENTSLRSMQYPSSINTSQGSSAASSILANSAQSKTPERSKLADDFRNRSGSDVLHTKPPISGGSDISGKAQSTAHHQLRERSSSEHDILSDRRQKHPSQQQVAQTNAHPREGAPMAVSKWRSGRAAGDAPTSLPVQTKVEIVSMKDGKFTPPPAQMITGRGEAKSSDRSEDSEGFADESYIGHKNKSSRAIGTYKRSKSAVVLESSGNGYKDGDSESLPFQDPKLGQQSWSSESVLSRTETAVDQELGTGRADSSGGDRVGTTSEYLNSASPSTPVRPARPSAQGRHSMGQLQISSLISSSSAYQNSNSSAASSPGHGSGHLGKHFVTDQPSHETRRDSLQRFPPASLPDPSYDPNPSTSRSKPQPSARSSNSPQRRPDDGVERGHFNNIGQSHYPAPKRNYPNDVASGINSWSPHNNNYAATSSPTSSQAGAFYSKPGDNGSWSPYDSPPDSASQREHQRRESAPVRLTTTTNIPESKLDVPQGDAAGTSRRRSDSNVNSAQRPDNSSYDASTSSHSRQPSQEELECDEKAKELAQELADNEQKLSEVLRLDANKKRMQYMDGLFSESVEVSNLGSRSSFSQDTRSSVRTRGPQHTSDGSSKNNLDASKRSSLPKEYWMSPSRALLEMELRRNEEVGKDLTKDINDSNTLMKHKEELLEKLHKKLEVLKEEKTSLQQEISDNNLLGKQVFETVEAKCQSHSERDKIKAYIDDLEKIVRLLLNLSGQLARAENAVQSLGPQVDAKLKKLTIDKRERLFAKHEEAKFLKEDIDKRSDQLSGVLRERLSDREFSYYTHFIKMKSKLTIDLQELDDKITLGEEQILELRKSIPDHGSSS